MNFSIVTVVAIIMLTSFSVISILLSLKNKLIKTACITVGLVLSVVIAVPVTKVMLDCCSWLLTDKFIEFFPEDIRGILNKMPEILESVLRMLASPILFIIVFGIAMIFMMIGVSIVGKYAKLKQKALPFKIITPIIAVLNAVIIVAVLLLPVSAYSHVINLTVEAATQQADNENGEDVTTGSDTGSDKEGDGELTAESDTGSDSGEEEPNTLSETLKALNLGWAENVVFSVASYTEKVDNDIIIKTIYTYISGPVYDEMCTVQFEGENFKFTDEIKPLFNVTGKAIAIVNDGELDQIDSEKIDKAEELVDDCEDSAIASIVLTAFVSDACEKWLDNENFMGMERPVIDEMVDPTVTEILKIFKTCDRENFKEDMYTILEVCRIMVDKGILENVNDYTKLLELIGGNGEDEGVITLIKNELGANARMAGLVEEIDRLSARVLCTVLNSLDSNEQYVQVKSDLANALSNNIDPDNPESVAQFKSDLKAAIDGADIGVEVPQEAVDKVAEIILENEQFVGRDDVTPDEVEEFIVEYAVSGAVEGENGIGDIIDEYESGSINIGDIIDEYESGSINIGDIIDEYESGSVDIEGIIPEHESESNDPDEIGEIQTDNGN